MLTYRLLKHSSNELDKDIEELLKPVNTTTNDTSSIQSKTREVEVDKDSQSKGTRKPAGMKIAKLEKKKEHGDE